jgi:Zn-dependent peptidase ImmA (M78 family)
MTARFASECEPPVAWSCPECGLLQLESGGREFTAEELEVIRSFEPVPTGRRRRTAAGGARTQAREILDALGNELPVDVESLAERLGYPVRWRSLGQSYRGGLEGDADHRLIVLNRDYPFRSEGERRWAVAEELAHAILGHDALVASDVSGGGPRLLEPSRERAEADAKAFAAELLMPAAAVRAAFQREQPVILRALGSDERDRAVRTAIADLAREFRVSQQALRIRLSELGLLT